MATSAISDLKYLESSLSAFRVDEVGTYTYIGRCEPHNYENVNQPVWQILRFDSTNGEGGQFASNEREANKVWNDRITYF